MRTLSHCRNQWRAGVHWHRVLNVGGDSCLRIQSTGMRMRLSLAWQAISRQNPLALSAVDSGERRPRAEQLEA
jgi:hypothetical protein